MAGDAGNRLSGGRETANFYCANDLKRFAYRNFWDEATAFTDQENEEKISEVNRGTDKGGKTLLVIAHRLSTIKNADQIIVLKEGEEQA